MDVILVFFFTAIFTWLFWSILKYVQRYKMFCDIYKSNSVQTIGDYHPIWGHLHLFKDYGELYSKMMHVVLETHTKIINFWVMFFFPTIVVCHPDTAKILLKSSEPKGKRIGGAYHTFMPWLGDGLLLSEGKKWLRNRRLLTPAFHYKILQPYVEIYNKVADIFLKKLSKHADCGESIDVFEPVGLATLDTMLRTAFSYNGHVQEQGDTHPYVEAVKMCSKLTSERMMKPWQFYYPIYKMLPSGRKFLKAIKYIHDFDEDIISKRRAFLAKGNLSTEKHKLDFLDILLTVRDENGNGLTDREIRDEVDTFLFAGYDTTSSAISWTIYTLAKHPEEQQKVYEEIKYILKDKTHLEWSDLPDIPLLTAFIKETLRLYPTVPAVARITTDYTRLENVTVPPNTEVYITMNLLHIHPDVWPDGQEFRPDRFLDPDIESRHPYSYIPFSAGPRNCIGQVFGMNEVKVILARLVYRFRINCVSDHVPELNPNITMKAKDGVRVKLQLRN